MACSAGWDSSFPSPVTSGGHGSEHSHRNLISSSSPPPPCVRSCTWKCFVATKNTSCWCEKPCACLCVCTAHTVENLCSALRYLWMWANKTGSGGRKLSVFVCVCVHVCLWLQDLPSAAFNDSADWGLLPEQSAWWKAAKRCGKLD